MIRQRCFLRFLNFLTGPKNSYKSQISDGFYFSDSFNTKFKNCEVAFFTVIIPYRELCIYFENSCNTLRSWVM